MPPKIALLVYAGLVLWLWKDAPRQGWSKRLWIPLTWILIIGTHPIGLWLTLLFGIARGSEGSNLDTAIFLGLIFGALRMLARKNTNWHQVFTRNGWIIAYFIYIGFSVLWSAGTFGSLRLWVKDIGNFVMVLALLGEFSNGQGAKASLVRAGYFLIPLSTLLVKYFPDLGRSYDVWTWRPLITGASESKNALGAAIILCSLGVFWGAFEAKKEGRSSKARLAARLLYAVMTIWLLNASSCATALACTVLGLTLALILRKQAIRAWLQHLGLSTIILVPLVLLFMHLIFGLGEVIVAQLGRDMTFTGRVPIWEAALNIPINPVTGCGYFSFWNEYGQTISSRLRFYFPLKEAHNGYLETYLNVGFLGLFLLSGAVISSVAKILKRMTTDGWHAVFRLVFVVVGLVYNVTESAFAGLNAIWFLMLLGMIEYPSPTLARRTARGLARAKTLHPSVAELGPVGADVLRSAAT